MLHIEGAEQKDLAFAVESLDILIGYARVLAEIVRRGPEFLHALDLDPDRVGISTAMCEARTDWIRNAADQS